MSESMLHTSTDATDDRVWLAQLNPQERSALFATFAGWMLDGMDVMVYSFVLPSLVVLWHISKGEAGLLGTSALLLSSLGGWLAGLGSDRFGRVKVLQWTILWFAFFTFLSGFSQNYTQLFVIRGMQGLGFGGEWAVGSVLIGETIRAKFRGRAVGTVQGGWAIGWGISALFYTLFFAVLSPSVAWRAMFWVGILPALLAFYVRKHVPEAQIFEERAESGEKKPGEFLKIFSPAMLRVTFLSSLVALGAQGGYYAITTWLPLYLNARGLSVLNTGEYLLVMIAGAFVGYLTSAWLADKIGRKWTLVLFAVCSFTTVVLYTVMPINDTVMLFLGFPLGFFPSGSFSPMGAFFTELFPTSLRGSGQGFSYNLGRGVGALFPALVGYMSARTTLGTAIALFSVSAYLLMVLGVLLLPETQGIELHEVDKIHLN
ncbi:MAG TPA: MFS transporter [Terracidiphilus sp.]|nr:MFS transporter [Terracidiphilus sp.]